MIEHGINKAQSRNTHIENNEIIVFTTDHNPNNPNICGVVKQAFNDMKQCVPLFENKKLVVAKRQPSNLKRILTKANYTSENINCCVSKCGKNCSICKLIVEGNSFQLSPSQEPFHVKYNFDCNSLNLIYAIICDQCLAIYIGETNCLRSRMTTHVQQIKQDNLRQLKVSKHIFQCSGGKFKVFPFYKMPTENVTERRLKEKYFIEKYQPSLNS